MNFTHWKTTVIGMIMAGLNAGVANYGVIAGDPASKMNWGSILISAAMAALGAAAADGSKVSGTNAGA